MRFRPTLSVVLATALGVPMALPVVTAPTSVAAEPITRCPSGSSLVSGKCEVTFTTSGTWSVPSYVTSIDVIAVGGGGGGGGATAYKFFFSEGAYSGGGGGGGEVRNCSAVGVGPGPLSVTVGSGGNGGGATVISGSDSVSGHAGGSGGKSGVSGCEANGGTGGGASNGTFDSGAGSGRLAAAGGRSGNGRNGGTGYQFPGVTTSAGGGGGAGGDGGGAASEQAVSGSGGAGVDGYGGGGGGGASNVSGSSGGSGRDGGGNGAAIGANNGGNATSASGGGGGGGSASFDSAGAGGNGASGRVIIRFAGLTNVAITVGATIDTKTFDGDTTSDVAPTVTVGSLFPGDTITAQSCPQVFDSEGAGSRTLSVSEGCRVLDSTGNDVTSFYTLTLGATANGEITKAMPDCDDTLTYNGDPRPVVCRDVAGQPLGGTTTLAPPTDVGDWDVTYSYVDSTGNHENVTDGTARIVIEKADPVCTVTGISMSYTTAAHLASGSCVGVKGEPLDGLDLSATSRTDIGTYTADPWTFTDVTGNYNDASGTVDSVIDKSQPAVRYTGAPEVFLNSTLELSATVDQAWCAGPVAYTITPDPSTGTGTMTVIGSSVSTAGWIPDVLLEVTATYPEDATCRSHSDSGELTVRIPDQNVTWNVDDTVWDIDTPVRLAAATTDGDGAIGYSIVSTGTAGCSLAGTAGRRLHFSRSGVCVVRATAAATPNFLEADATRTITVQKARVPEHVRGLRVTSVNPRTGKVVLDWRSPADHGTHPILRYRVRVRERQDAEYTVYGHTTPGRRTMTVTGLEPGFYYLRVRTANAAGPSLGQVIGPVYITGPAEAPPGDRAR